LGATITCDWMVWKFAEFGRDYGDAPFEDGGGGTYNSSKLKRLIQRGHGVMREVHRFDDHLAIRDEPFHVSPRWDQGMRDLAALSQTSGIPLLVRLAPCPSDFIQRRDFSRIVAWLADVQKDYPDIVVARPEILSYDPALCADFRHLNVEGCRKFTALVADEFQAAIRSRGAKNTKLSADEH
jgi:hypothetical protein